MTHMSANRAHPQAWIAHVGRRAKPFGRTRPHDIAQNASLSLDYAVATSIVALERGPGTFGLR